MAPTHRWRSVAIPREHGGWGVTLEPVLLGLLVAWSLPGLLLGVAAFGAFLLRTPLKLAAVDMRRHQWRSRSTLAARIAAVELLVVVTAVAGVVVSSGWRWALPVVVAAPLVFVEGWYDVRSRSRRLIPEIAGPVGIGSVAAAIALVGGQTMKVALGLWLIVALRSIASVVLVRAQLRRAKAQPYREVAVHAVDASVASVAVLAAAFEVVPWLGAVAIALLTPFGWWSLWRPAVRAVIVGTHQTLLGVLVVVLTAIGSRAGI